MISEDDLWKFCDGKFKVKLSYSIGSLTNETTKTATGGVFGENGIIKKLQELHNNPLICGYIEDVFVEPYISENGEVKMNCFNGEAIFPNKRKRASNGSSPFPKAPNAPELLAFAEEVIAVLRAGSRCIMVDGLLRVDFFRLRSNGKYYVNSVSGYEAEVDGVGLGNKWNALQTKCVHWWIKELNAGMLFQLKRIKHFLFEVVVNEDIRKVGSYINYNYFNYSYYIILTALPFRLEILSMMTMLVQNHWQSTHLSQTLADHLATTC